MKITFSLILILLLLSSKAFSQQDTTAKGDLTLHGYLEPYFSWQPHFPETEKNIFYNYTRSNAVSLNLGMITLDYSGTRWRGTLSVQAGDFPKYNYAKEPPFFRHIYQGSVGVKINEKMSLDAGIFPSHIGHESAIGKDNWNLTRSFTAENTPYYETGVKLNYTWTKKLTLLVAVLNGWQRIKDNNHWPAFGTQLTYKPSEKVVINSCTFIGNEQPEGTAGRVRYFHDFYTIIDLTKRFSTILSFDIGAQHHPLRSLDWWYNPTIKFRYKCNKWLALAARGEYYRDKYQVIIKTGTDQGIHVWAYSGNIDFALNKNILIRAEARFLEGKYPVVYNGFKSSKNLYFYTSSVCLSL